MPAASSLSLNNVALLGVAGGTAPFVGPLDAYTTNLTDAFSAEYRLLSSYTGGAMQVRAAASGDEEVIGFTGDGVFNATAFDSFVFPGLGYAVSWLNQVSGGPNCDQTGDASKQGRIDTGAVNSGTVINMDNTDDGYDSIRTLTRPWTIYLVEQGKAFPVQPTPRTLNSSLNCLVSTSRSGLNNAYIAAGLSSYAVAAGTPAVAALVGPSAADAAYYVDGVDRTQVPGNTNQWGTLCLGMGAGTTPEPANSLICELLVYDVAHDAGTVAAITAILAGLRGIPV